MFPRLPVPRCPNFDYRSDGWYFVTTCTARRRQILGSVVDGNLVLSRAGEIVANVWRRTAEVDSHVILDEFVVMPDHVHGIIRLDGVHATRDGRRNLSTIVGSFKRVSSLAIREVDPDIGQIWQRSYYDRIIRSGSALDRVRSYIRANPSRWIADHATTP